MSNKPNVPPFTMPKPVDVASITPPFSRSEPVKSVTPTFSMPSQTVDSAAVTPPFSMAGPVNENSITRLRRLLERIRTYAAPFKNRKLNSLLVEMSVEIEKLK